MWEMRKRHKIEIEKYGRNKSFDNPERRDRIALKATSKQHGMRVWSGYKWLRKGPNGQLL
jgi:hypothetical protein